MTAEDYSDVISKDVTIESIRSVQFEFEGFFLKREMNHWEIQFESEKGFEAILVSPEDFYDGECVFEIDDQIRTLTIEDFNRTEQFCTDQALI